MSLSLSIQSALKQVPNKYCCLIPIGFSCPFMLILEFPSQISQIGNLAPGLAKSAIQTIFQMLTQLKERKISMIDVFFIKLSQDVLYYIQFSHQFSLKSKGKMKRYFYQANPLIKKLLENQYNLIRREDQIYRDALLAALYLQPSKIKSFNSLRQSILDLTIQQQLRYANNYHLEALYHHFHALHINSKGRKMILRGNQSFVKDLVDPDKFPIWDLRKKPDIFHSIWNTISGKIRYDMGHQLILKNSLIEHPEGGRGVFVELASRKEQIEIGDFLGLVPGIVYPAYESYKKVRIDTLKSYERIPEHLHFPSGKVLELGEYKYFDSISEKDISLEPMMINPYAVGHFINHPPYGQKANVIFTEIESRQNFFPGYLRKYNPYNYFLPKQKINKKPIFGIFACRTIKNREQLYVDYCENHIYPIDRIPEWMIEPDYSIQENAKDATFLNLLKQQYEHTFPSYLRYLEHEALKQKKQLYEKYLKQTKYRPGQLVYEDGKIKIKKMYSSKQA